MFRNIAVPGSLSQASFQAHVSLGTVPGVPYDLVASDLDGDGKADIAYSDNTNGLVYFLRSQAVTGAAVTAASFVTQATFTGSGTGFIEAADIDGDGRTEIISAGTGNSLLYAYRNVFNPTLSLVNITKVYGDGTFVLSATTNSPGAIVYSSSNTSVISISGTTATVAGAGTATITVSLAASADFGPLTITASAVVVKATPTLSLADITKAYGDAPFTLTPAVNSANPISFSSDNTDVISIGATSNQTAVANVHNTGTAVITLVMPETANYIARSITTTITVEKAVPQLGLADITKTYGTGSFVLSATTNSDGALNYESGNTGVIVLSGQSNATASMNAAGTAQVTVTQAATSNFQAFSVTANVTVLKATPTVNIEPSSITAKYGTAPFTYLVSVSPVPDGTVTFTSSNSQVASVDGNIVTLDKGGTATITANVAATAGYYATSATAQVTVTQATASVTFNSFSKTYGEGSFDLTATTTSDGTIGYVSSNPALLEINGKTATIKGAGTVQVIATVPATGNFMSASATATVDISKANQSLTLSGLPTSPYKLKDFVNQEIPLTATSTSGLPVVISLGDGSPAELVNGTGLKSTSTTGIIEIIYAQAGNENFNAITKTSSFDVVKDQQSISYTTALPGTVLYQTGLTITLTGVATSGLSVTYSVQSGPGVVDNNTGILNITGTGSVLITASQAGNTFYNQAPDISNTIIVSQGVPSISLANMTKRYEDADFVLNGITTSDATIHYTSSAPAIVKIVSPNIASILDGGAASITAYVDATANFVAASATANITILQATPVLTLSPSTVVYGDGPFSLTPKTVTTSNGAITYTSPDASVISINGSQVTIVGGGTAIVTATLSPTARYVSVSATTTVDVKRTTPELSLAPISKTFGDGSFTLSATTNYFGGPITYSSSDPNVISINGTTATVAGGGTATITVNVAETANFPSFSATTTAIVSRATPTLNFANITKTFGEADFALTATTNYYGGAITYTSSNPSVINISGTSTGEVKGGGTADITIYLAETANFNALSATATATVGRATPTLNFANITKTFGEADFALTATTNYYGGAITYTSSNPSVINISGTSTGEVKGGGTADITIYLAETANFNALSATATATVGRATPTLNFANITKTFGDADFTLSATTNYYGGAITYSSSDAAVVSISGTNTGVVVGGGTVTITVSVAETTNFNAYSTTAIVTVGKLTPTLALADITKTFGDADFTLSATTNYYGGAITYSSSDAAVVSISGTNTGVVVGGGTVTITVSVAETTNFNAFSATATVTVGKLTPTLALADITKTLGDADFTLSATTNYYGGAITYSSSDAAVVSISGTNTGVVVGGGTASITIQVAETVNFNAFSVTASAIVGKITPTLSLAPISKSFADQPFTLSATTNYYRGTIIYTSDNTSVVSISGTNTAVVHGVGTATITITVAETADYFAYSTTATVRVGKVIPTLSLAPISKVFGDQPFTLSATTNYYGGELMYSSDNTAVIAISGTTTAVVKGAGTATITVSVGETAYFAAASATTSVSVSTASSTISLGDISKVYGDASFTLSATTNSNGLISYTTDAPGVLSISGNQVTIIGAGTAHVTASVAATANFAAASVTASVYVSPATGSITISPASIVANYGVAPLTYTLSSVVNSDGVVSYASSNPAVISVVGTTATVMGSGVATITASVSATANYTAASATASVTVTSGSTTISFSNINKVYGDGSFTLNAVSNSGGAITYFSADPSIISVSGNTATILKAGTVTLTAEVAATPQYGAATATAIAVVSKATQVLSLSGLPDSGVPLSTYLNVPIQLAGSSTAGLSVTLSLGAGSPATLSVDDRLTLTAATGTLTVIYSQPGNENYNAASGSLTVDVTRSNQAISFVPALPSSVGYQPGLTLSLTGSASSGLTVTYTVQSGSASVSGNVLTVLGGGTVILTADQSGDNVYNAAPTQWHTINVTRAAVSIEHNNISKVYGDGSFVLSATTNSDGVVEYVSSDPLVLSVSGNIATVVGAGNAILTVSVPATANYVAASTTANVSVSVATGTLSVSPSSISTVFALTGAGTVYTFSSTSNSNGVVSYSSSDPSVIAVVGTTATVKGAGTATITASVAATANYTAASATVSVVVSRASATVTLAPMSKTYGDASFTLGGTTNSDAGITYSSSNPLVVSVSGNTATVVGAGTAVITASVTQTTNYTAATTTANVTVDKASATIHLNDISKVYGDAAFTLSATTNNPAGVITYSSDAPSVVSISGNTATIHSGGVATITATVAASANYYAASTTATVTVAAATPNINMAAISKVYGSAPFTLSATTNSDGAISYVSADPYVLGINGNTATVTGGGSTTVKVMVAATANFAAASVTVAVTVSTVTTTISITPAVTNIIFTGAPQSYTLTATTNSDGAVTYASSDPSVVSISGNTATVKAAGHATITATVAATANFIAASSTASVSVSTASSTISLANISKQYGDAPFTLSAVTNADGLVTYTSSNAGVVTISGNSATVTGAGSAIITATVAATANFAAASTTATVTVSKQTPTLTITPTSINAVNGAAPLTYTLNYSTNSNGIVSFASSNTSVALVSGNTVSIVGAGSATITATVAATTNFAASSATATVTASKEMPVINFANISRTYGDADFTLKAITNSDGAITYTSSDPSILSITGSQATIHKAGTVHVTADIAATTNFAAVSATSTVVISKAKQVLTLAGIDVYPLSYLYFTNEKLALSATSTSGLAVTLTLGAFTTSGVADLTGNLLSILADSGNVNVELSQAGDDNYEPAGSSVNWNIQGDNQRIVYTTDLPATVVYEPGKTIALTAQSTLENNGSNNFPITYSVSGPGVITGNTLLITAAGTIIVTANQAGDPGLFINPAPSLQKIITVTRAVPTITADDIAKTFGDAPFTLTATTNSDGDISYVPENSLSKSVVVINDNTATVTGAGSTHITVNVAETNNYLAGSATLIMLVLKSPATLSIAPAAINTVYGSGTMSYTLTSTTASDGVVSYSSSNTSVVRINGNIATVVGAGSAIITASVPATRNYQAASSQVTVNVSKLAASISNFHPLSKTYGDPDFLLGATTNSDATITYTSSDPSVISISGNRASVVSGGSAIITASVAQTANYGAASATANITVNSNTPTLSLANVSKVYGDAQFILAAVTNSNGAISYVSDDPSVISIVANKATIRSGGTAHITATVAATANFVSVTTTATITVSAALPTLSMADITRAYGSGSFVLSAATNSDGLVTYTSSNPAVLSINTTAATVGVAGTATITVQVAGTANFAAVSATAMVTVYAATPTITLTPTSITAVYGVSPMTYTLSATALSGGAITYVSSNPSVVSISGNIATITGGGSAIITATVAATANFTANSVTAAVVVSAGAGTITLADITKVYGDAPFTLSAVTNSGGAITYTSSNPSVIAVNGNTATVVGAGNATITANVAATTSYSSASIAAMVRVSAASGTITLGNLNKVYGDVPFTLSATTNSGGAISYISSDPSVVSITGETVTIVGAGTATISANLAATNNYTAATTTATVTVSPSNGTIAMGNLNKVYGDVPFTLSATTNSGGAISYISNDPSVVSITGQTATIVGAGTATITANLAATTNYTGATTTATIKVGAATSTVVMGNINKVYGDAPFTLSAVTSSNGPISYVSSDAAILSINGNTATIQGAGSAVITVNVAATAGYPAMSATATVTVAKATPVMSFSNTSKVFGNAPFVPGVSTNSPGTLRFASNNLSVVSFVDSMAFINGGGQATVTVTVAETANFMPYTITATITVLQAPATIAMTNLNKSYGDAPFALTSTTNSDGAVVYESSNAAIVTISGNTATITGAGTATITARVPATANFLAASTTVSLFVEDFNPAASSDKIMGPDYICLGSQANYTDSLSISGGTWSSSNSSIISISASGVATALTAGTAVINYTIKVGSRVIVMSKSVTVQALPSVSITSVTNRICTGTDLILQASNTGLISYTWYRDGAVIAAGTNNLNSFSTQLPGTYTLSVADANRCSVEATNSITLTTISKPAPDFTYSVSCVSKAGTFTSTTVSNDPLPVNYSWSVDNSLVSNSQSFNYQFAGTGNYQVKLVASIAGCDAAKDSVTKSVIVADPVPAEKTVVNVLKNTATQLSARNIGVSYTWYPSKYLDDSTIVNPVITADTGIVYTIKIVQASGCQTIDTLQVIAFSEDKGYVYAPNSFSPNGDGINDLFLLNTVSIKTLNRFIIYNQYHQVMFETSDVNKGWDGRYNGVPVPVGTYIWVVQAVTTDGKTVVRSGAVNIIK